MGKVTTRRKHSKTLFKKGHTYLGSASTSGIQVQSGKGNVADRWLPRMTQEEYNLVVKTDPRGQPSLPDHEGVCTGAKLLRPKKQEVAESDTTAWYLHGTGRGENRIFQKDKLLDMWNKCIEDHAKNNKKCNYPRFEVAKEVQKGLAWSQSLKCSKCKYRSKLFKLYDEVQSDSRGPKYAQPNLGLQVGLQECPMSNTKAQQLLLSANVPAPARSGMQRAANKVGKLTSEAAERDLSARVEKMKSINTSRTLEEDSPVGISIDIRYNSSCGITTRNKMGQSASQAIGVAIEHHTDEKQIVGLCLENKLCPKGARLRSRGIDAKCPGGHKDCTATKTMAEPFTEREIGRKLGADIAKQGVPVKYVTTDGDGRSCEGVEAAMSRSFPNLRVRRQADTTHMGQSLFRKVMKASFSNEMLPGTSADEKHLQHRQLAADLKRRSHVIFQTMHRNYAGAIHKMKSKMPSVIEQTIQCYSGDCSRCRKLSVVCRGGKKNWMAKSGELQSCGLTSLQMSEKDKEVMRELLNFYLGCESIELMKLNTNTNKNEAVNRAISASLPKNNDFSRNAKARAMSAVCRINKGAGNSMADNLKVVKSPVSKGGAVAKGMRTLQLRAKYHKDYAKSERAKAARNRRKYDHMREYCLYRFHRRQGDYLKGQLDPYSPAQYDHNDYCRRPMQHHKYNMEY